MHARTLEISSHHSDNRSAERALVACNYHRLGDFRIFCKTFCAHPCQSSLTGIVSGKWQTNKRGWGLSECSDVLVELSVLTNVAKPKQRKAVSTMDSSALCSGPWAAPWGSDHSHRWLICWMKTCVYSLFFSQRRILEITRWTRIQVNSVNLSDELRLIGQWANFVLNWCSWLFCLMDSLSCQVTMETYY